MLSYEIFDSIRNVQNEWDSFVGKQPFLNSSWLVYAERIQKVNIPKHIVIREGKTIIGCATLWVTFNEELPIKNKFVHDVALKLIKAFPLIHCCSPFVSQKGFLISNNRQDAFGLLLKVSDELADQYRASAIIYDYIPSTTFSGFDLPSDYFIESWPYNTQMVVQGSHDDYLDRLSSNGRRSYRSLQEWKEKNELSVRFVCKVEDVNETLSVLQYIFDKYSIYPPPTLKELIQNLDHNNCLEIRDKHRNLIGAFILLSDQLASWRLSSIGYIPGQNNIYHLLWDEAIKHVHEQATCKSLLLGGSGAYEPKRRRGFEEMPLYSLSKIRFPGMRLFNIFAS